MSEIIVEDLRKSYRSEKGESVTALDGVSFAVPAGKVFGLLGPNGAGKTTLVKILTTITTPTSGEAWIRGSSVTREGLQVRKEIVVVLQQTAVDSMLTVEDNLRLFAQLHGVSRREIDRRLEPVLEEFELDEKRKETVHDLSIGTKRRVQVAKVFMVDSPVIFLDESTTGMDPMMKRRVLDRIRREAQQGKTVLLTTQVLSEAEELCDTIMIIDHGKALASGSMTELRNLSRQLFKVELSLGEPTANLEEALRALEPHEFSIEGDRVRLLFRGEESRMMHKLAGLSEVIPIRSFEIRGADLEEIFVELVGEGNPKD